MGATGKFIWPLPDKGLKKRIHRVRVPTLLVWGKEDRLVPPVYAEEFARRIAGARVATVEQAGHAPHLEQPETVARLVREFLGECLPARPPEVRPGIRTGSPSRGTCRRQDPRSPPRVVVEAHGDEVVDGHKGRVRGV